MTILTILIQSDLRNTCFYSNKDNLYVDSYNMFPGMCRRGHGDKNNQTAADMQYYWSKKECP